MNQSFHKKEWLTWQAEAAGGARQRAPKRKLRLRASDVSPALVCKRLQLFWPEDGHWWPGTVTALRLRERRATLLYDTGACLGRCHFTLCLSFVLTRSDLPAAWPQHRAGMPCDGNEAALRLCQDWPETTKRCCTLCFSTQREAGCDQVHDHKTACGGTCK